MTSGLLTAAPLRRSVTRRVGRWARKRQGTDPATTVLESRRIYILPTGVGIVFGIMTFAMLLGSMNYNNNLSFVLTFLLTSIGFVAMHQCQRNLVGLEIGFAGVDPVFAGQVAEFRIAVTNHSKSRRYCLQLYSDNYTGRVCNLGPGESKILRMEVSSSHRGRISLPRFGIRTLFPFEMFRAWAWLHMDLHGMVYPAIADPAPEPPAALTAHGHRQHDARGEEDFAGLRDFHAGDSPRHVAWKAYARTGELLSKQFAGADTSTQWFDFRDAYGADTETRLSVLCRWITDADRHRTDYGLRIPGGEYAPAHGGTHRHNCLAALALFDELAATRER